MSWECREELTRAERPLELNRIRLSSKHPSSRWLPLAFLPVTGIGVAWLLLRPRSLELAAIAFLAFAVVVLLLLRRSERRRNDRALAAARAEYQQLLDTAQEGVLILDADACTSFLNNSMTRMLGGAAESVIGRALFDFVHQEDAHAFQKGLELLKAGEGWEGEARLIAPGGQELWASICARPRHDAQGKYLGALATVGDMTKSKQMQQRLAHLADHDRLTGVFNRSRLISEIERHLREKGPRSRGAVLTLDLDHFKLANDTYGHAAGDARLQAVAKTLRARTRNTDVVARIGGDEFAVVLPGALEDDAVRLAGDIRRALTASHITPPIMTSIGIALFDAKDELTADDVLVCADTAAYEAKEAGGDQARVYHGDAAGAMLWVDRVRAALADDRFVLYGQPIVNLRSGAITHHELLIRMLADDGDVIPPAAFLSTAERFGLIREIDRWVTEAALSLARHGAAVAINLSTYSIGDQRILEKVRDAIEDGLPPSRVMFEITETAAMTNIEGAKDFAETLHRVGCAFALDDFGTGFGSFTYLKSIPADYLKIDTEFVRELKRSHTDREVVRSIVGIARSLGKLTIAEGVEDAETLGLVRSLGVDHAQGFHLGMPQRLSPPTAHERELQRSGLLGSQSARSARSAEREGGG